MPILKGGRGKKAPWEVTHVRCPEPIKVEVQRLIDQWKEQELTGNGGESVKPLTAIELEEKAAAIVKRKKSARESLRLLAAELGYQIEV